MDNCIHCIYIHVYVGICSYVSWANDHMGWANGLGVDLAWIPASEDLHRSLPLFLISPDPLEAF